MNLLIHQMMQLDDIHVTDGDSTVKRFTGTTVIQCGLTGFRQVSQFQHALNVRLLGAIKHRCGDRNATLEVVGQFSQSLFIHRGNITAG